jgi:hypothetical protein
VKLLTRHIYSFVSRRTPPSLVLHDLQVLRRTGRVSVSLDSKTRVVVSTLSSSALRYFMTTISFQTVPVFKSGVTLVLIKKTRSSALHLRQYCQLGDLELSTERFD